MTAVTIEALHLKRILAAAKAVVPSKSTIPILSCVKLVTRGLVMTMDATNLTTSVRCEVPASGDGSWCLDFAKLQGLLSVVPDGAMIGIDGTTIATVRAGKTSARISSFPIEDFPDVMTGHENPDVTISVRATALKEAIKRVHGAREADSDRAGLSGIHVVAGAGQLIVEAASGGMMMRVTMVIESRAELNFLLPGEIVSAVHALPDDGEIEIRKSAGTVSFWAGTMGLATKLMDYEYHDLNQLVARYKPVGDLTTFDTASLAAAVKACGGGSWQGCGVEIEVTSDGAMVMGSGGAGEGIYIPVDCTPGMPFSAMFNPSFLLPMLASVKHETVALGWNGDAMICGDNQSPLYSLVMSMRGNAAARKAA